MDQQSDLSAADAMPGVETDLHPVSLAGAHVFLSILGFKDHKIEERTNVALQTGQDCGWLVCHWIEELMRRQAGHLKQSQGWPYKTRLTRMQAYLNRMIETLEGERLKWAEEVEEAIKKNEESESKLRALSEAYFMKHQLASRVVEEHKAVAKALLEAGAAVEPPALSEDFLLRYAEHVKKRKEALEEKKRKMGEEEKKRKEALEEKKTRRRKKNNEEKGEKKDEEEDKKTAEQEKNE